MAEEFIVTFIRTFGTFLSEVETFFVNLTPGYFLLIGGLFIASVVMVVFWVIKEQIMLVGS